MAKKLPYRYENNPFLEDPTGVTSIKTRKKSVLIGKGDSILLNQESGEITSTNVVAIREVDDSQFVKIFTQNIQLMLGLTPAGNKVFMLLLWAVQNTAIGKDIVYLGLFELNKFLEENSSIKMSETTMRRGISELVEAKIIAHTKKNGSYFINPNFIFNGDRVRFITEIRRKKVSKTEELEAAGQMRLIG